MDSVLRYRYRAYPDPAQTRALSRLFGCCRVAFNDALTIARTEHVAGRRYPGATALQHQVLTLGKQTAQRGWMGEVSGVALIQAVRDADTAYRNFFASINGTRAGRTMGSPRFRSRHDSRQAARFTSAARFTVTTDPADPRSATVRLPKVGDIRFVLSRPLPTPPAR